MNEPDGRRERLPWLRWPSVGVLLVIGGALALSATFLVWKAVRDPHVPMLLRDEGIPWLVFPKPFSRSPQRRVPMTATFRRRLHWQRLPPRVVIDWRAHQQAEIVINGRTVFSTATDPTAANRADPTAAGRATEKAAHETIGARPKTGHATQPWKTRRRLDVRDGLNKGENLFEFRVTSDFGPPALWVRIRDDKGKRLAADDGWSVSLAGSAWRDACRAERLVTAFAESQPTREILPRGPATWRRVWTKYAVAALLLAVLGWWLSRTGGVYRFMPSSQGLGERWEEQAVWWAVGVVGVAYVVLVSHNARWLYASAGYDAMAHLEYIQYILNHRRLPLADEGWEMYHPPLYYLTAAVALGMSGQSAGDAGGLALIRGLGALAAWCSVALVAGSLKRLFPSRWQLQVAGTILVAFLPGHLALAHYPTNELFCAAFSAAAVWWVAKGASRGQLSRWESIALGACLGAALLSKATGLIPAAVVLCVLAGDVIVRGAWRRAGAWFDSVGVATITMLLVCGWHYGRVWHRFGTPFALNVETAFPFWQDPGVQTLEGYYLFARTFTDPFFAGAAHWLDGVFSTAFGDGNLGGAGVGERPPWNYTAMVCGYWLAIGPIVAVAIGVVRALLDFIRRPNIAWFAIWGTTFGIVWFMVYAAMFAPWFSAAKGTYMFPALIALAVFGGLGVEWLVHWCRWCRWLPWVIVGVWAANAGITFWIAGDTAETHTRIGQAIAIRQRRFQQAAAHFQRALVLNPRQAEAHFGLASLFAGSGQLRQAERHYAAALRIDPERARWRWELGVLRFQQGRFQQAEREAREALALPLDHWSDTEPHAGSRALLAQIVARTGNDALAIIAAYRELLCYDPQNVAAHRAIARHAMRLGRFPLAEQHANMALVLQPQSAATMADWAELQARQGRAAEAVRWARRAVARRPESARAARLLAWLLASDAQATAQQTDEALRWAEAAVRATKKEDARTFDAQAAALARAGRYDQAVEAADRAIRIARDQNMHALAEAIEQRRAAYQRHRPAVRNDENLFPW